MDGDMKHLRVRFSGMRHEDYSGGETIPAVPSQQSTGFSRGLLSNAEEYDAAYAATVAAVAYAIAAREERLASREKPVADKFGTQGKPMAEKVASGKKPTSISEPPTTSQSNSPPKRGESFKMPIEGSRSSKWFSGNEPIDDGYDDILANVSVRRPIRPAQKKPDGVISSDGKVSQKLLNDSAPSIKKEPSFIQRAPEKKGSWKFKQDEGNQTVPPTAVPMTRPLSSYSGRESRVDIPKSESEVMADAWEKEKLGKIKKKYNEAMETIAEWEAEKKAKARRQKGLESEGKSERKRTMALEEYNKEMSRINKVAAASRLAEEEKRKNTERKVRDKAQMIRSTGKLPQTCGCF